MSLRTRSRGEQAGHQTAAMWSGCVWMSPLVVVALLQGPPSLLAPRAFCPAWACCHDAALERMARKPRPDAGLRAEATARASMRDAHGGWMRLRFVGVVQELVLVLTVARALKEI